MTEDLSQRIAWHHFRFRIPADWEVTSYAMERRVGRLEFSTRRGFEAMVSWEPCKREPDRESTMLSFLEKLVPGERKRPDRIRAGALQTWESGGFLVGWCDETRPCQALKYLAESKVLLRWVFERGPRSRLDDVWLPVLKSWRPNDGPVRRYHLFGLDFVLSAEFELEEMNALPANVRLLFESDRRHRVTFRRWGLPEVILQGVAVQDFYPRFLNSQGCMAGKVKSDTLYGMPAVWVTYSQVGQHRMDHFMGRFWEGGQAVCWHDRTEKRIYAFEQIGPRHVDLLRFRDVFGRQG
jgi:hypothetical protein